MNYNKLLNKTTAIVDRYCFWLAKNRIWFGIGGIYFFMGALLRGMWFGFILAALVLLLFYFLNNNYKK